jgi:hypothetical protein
MSILGNVVKAGATAALLTGAVVTITTVAAVAHVAEAALSVYGLSRDAVRAAGAVPLTRHRGQS